MGQFQIMSVKDNMIYITSSYVGWTHAFMRSGILIEQQEVKSDGENSYKTMYIDQTGEVIEIGDACLDEAYLKVCHPGECFYPRKFASAIDLALKDDLVHFTFDEIIALGGKLAEIDNPIIDILVSTSNRGPDIFHLDSLHEVLTFGDQIWFSNPFIKTENETRRESLPFSDAVSLLAYYKHIYKRPDLEVKMSFLDPDLNEKPDSWEEDFYQGIINKMKELQKEWGQKLQDYLNSEAEKEYIRKYEKKQNP